METIYHEGNRELQDVFDSRRLADRLHDLKVHDEITNRDRTFIEARDMMFISTVDAIGCPTVSYKGGNVGFVKVVDEQTLAFPGYDGNGMFLTAGNISKDAAIGLLFIDLENPMRLRAHGKASVHLDDDLLGHYPEAKYIIRVKIDNLFVNCPRYIHKYKKIETSDFIPQSGCKTPEPEWKEMDDFKDVLPKNCEQKLGIALMETQSSEIISLVDNAKQMLCDIFQDRCIAIYIMGSLARGGFRERVSDIDMGIILAGELEKQDGDRIENIQNSVMKKHPLVSNHLSIFWGTVESLNGTASADRYPPFDRLDLIDHGRLLTGRDIREKLVRPSRKELEMASAEFALGFLGDETRIKDFRNPSRIVENGVLYITKIVLFPPRFIYLAETGLVAGNDDSVNFYTGKYTGRGAKLVGCTLDWRMNGLPDDLSKVSETLNSGLLDLYCRFIDTYIERMRAYKENELEAQLVHWKSQISDD